MKLKLFLLSLIISCFSNSLLGQENNESKNLNIENNTQNTFNNKKFDNVIIHVVQKGDTLSSLSKKYSIKKDLIIKANSLVNENYIYIGQNLKIVENFSTETNNHIKTSYHEIKEGENLTEIANKYNLKLSHLIELNNIENKNMLVVGTKLKLKEESSKSKKIITIETKEQVEIDETIKNNKYGPLLIRSENKNIKKKKNKIFLEASHKNGKKLMLKINCDKKEINVRGIGRKWKGWMPVRDLFEIKLLNDFC